MGAGVSETRSGIGTYFDSGCAVPLREREIGAGVPCNLVGP